MAVYITDTDLEERLKAEREASGADRFDEAWEGVYFMPPLANNEHQDLATRLAIAIHPALDQNAKVYVGVNVSDREEDWKYNYRCPDVAVYLQGSPAKDCGTHWCGGPDFACEIVSPRDRSREKLAFYAAVGVRELLLIDRDPWQLELHELRAGELTLTGRSTLEQPTLLASRILPLRFRLVPGRARPHIEVTRGDGTSKWMI